MSSAFLLSPGATEDAINAAREAFHVHMAATQKVQQHVQDTSEEDLSQLDERELDAEFAGLFLISVVIYMNIQKSNLLFLVTFLLVICCESVS